MPISTCNLNDITMNCKCSWTQHLLRMNDAHILNFVHEYTPIHRRKVGWPIKRCIEQEPCRRSKPGWVIYCSCYWWWWWWWWWLWLSYMLWRLQFRWIYTDILRNSSVREYTEIFRIHCSELYCISAHLVLRNKRTSSPFVRSVS